MMSLILALLISLLGAFIAALVLEREREISTWLICLATQSMPPEMCDTRREQWLADSNEIRGATWTILHAIGCVWLSRNWIYSSFLSRFRVDEQRYSDLDYQVRHVKTNHEPAPEVEVPNLSLRERTIVHYAAVGKTNWEISLILGIDEYVVRQDIKNVMDKLGCVNRAHTVAVSIRRGLISF